MLRVEDHDRERCRPEYEAALLDDLDWLGFVPDLFPTSAFRAGSCESRQSERGAIYAAAAADLEKRGLLYGCSCSRRQIADAGSEDPASIGDGGGSEAGSSDPATPEVRYPGTCRDRGLGLREGVAWRLRMDPGEEAFDDLLLGPQRQDPSTQCGDVVIRDRLGNWTYQFVAAVDDFRQGIDLVVRGRDLLASTGRQIRIAGLLDRREPAVFAHHELIMKSETQKLSKSDRDTGVRDLRTAGWSREQVLRAALSVKT